MKKLLFLLSFFCTRILFGQETGRSFHNSPENSDIHSSKGFRSFGDLQWKFKTGGKIFSSPAVYRGLVFIGSEDKNVYAINTANHKLIWKFATRGAIHSSPVVYHNAVYFNSADGNFYAVDASSGKLKWKFGTNGEKQAGRKGLWTMKPLTEYMEDPFDFFLSSAIIDEAAAILYFGSGDGNVYALNANDGSLQWKFASNGIVHTSPALYNGIVYIGSWDTWFYALDAKTGKEKWKFKTGMDSAYHLLEGIQSSPTIYDHGVYFGARDGYFYALDAATGKLNWKYSANNSWILTTAAAMENTIYIGTSDSYLLLALDATTGKEKFRVQANGYVYSSPLIMGNSIYFGDFTGQLFAVDINSNGKMLDRFATDGRKQHAPVLLKSDKLDFAYAVNGMDLSLYSSTVTGMKRLFSLGPIVSSPAIADGIIYFGSADSCLYALKLSNYHVHQPASLTK